MLRGFYLQLKSLSSFKINDWLMYPQMPKIENILTNGVLESMPNRGLYETFLGLLMLIFVLYVKSAKSLQQSKVFIQYSLIVFGCLVFLFYSSSLIELVLA